MKGVKQGIRSTKNIKEAEIHELADGTTLKIPMRKHNDVYV